MITIENEEMATVVTVMDEEGNHEDVQLIQDGETVYIRQFNEDEGDYDLIIISPRQFMSLYLAQTLPEGTYKAQ